MKDFLYGFTYPFKSLKFFFSYPKLIFYSVIPVFINLLIYGTIFIITYSYLIGFINKTFGFDDNNSTVFLDILQIILQILSFLLLLFICYLLFISLGNIITAPFNEEISQKVEHIVTEGTVKYEVGFWKDAFISIKSEVQKILFYLSFLFLIFLLNFIPVAGNTLSFILGTVFSFYFNAFDFLDYPMTRKMLKFRQKLKITNSEKYITFGFGAAAFILMFLPIVNVFLKPVLVTAGTSLYYNKYYILNNN